MKKYIQDWRNAGLSMIVAAGLLLGGMAVAPAAGAAPVPVPASVSVHTAVIAPKITGDVKVGSRISIDLGDVTGTDWAYLDLYLDGEWEDVLDPVGDIVRYTIPAHAAGKKLTFEGSYWDEGNFGEFTLDGGMVTGGIIKPSKSLKISGTARYGSTLKVSAGWPSGSKASYQWYRGTSKISGATKTAYKPISRDIGKTISVKATVKKVGFNDFSATAKSAKASKGELSTKTAPKVSGTKKAGHTLKVSKGSYSAKPSSYDYRWYRGSSKIKGATKSNYRVTSSDVGKKITAKVTIKRSHYSTRTVASRAVSIPRPPKPPRVVIRGDGTYRVGSGIKPGLYKATGGTSCYWATLSGFSGSFDEINHNYLGTGNTYVRITSSDKGFKTSRCGSWKTVSSSGPKASKITRDGTYRVGIDIKPGTYVGRSSGDSCYWAVLNDFTGDFDEIEDNYLGSARTIVDIPSSAAGFKVSRCGTLVRD
ncbi:hypothetical protein [Paeniglutamicibacter kerguelensis]|uniref:Uncharacterized protein n=1 Tax=Paeniglutamicibacter kerguelensis TaxID=254788 RepID=A0ABS4XGZ4_9MICC|nr:hypothetical protein [Paeniglutamicibacter kerguelensis]MBP2387616.1 hypothetical protein [Paeniglutamicibacter kerguelensis]